MRQFPKTGREWPEEDIKHLFELFTKHQSQSYVARIWKKYNKNQVIGQINRLREKGVLPKSVAPELKSVGGVRKEGQETPNLPRGRRPTLARLPRRPAQPKAPREPKSKERTPPSLPVPALAPENMPGFLDLEPHQCSYCLGPDQNGIDRYCGKMREGPSWKLKPYCEKHNSIARR